MRKKRDYVSLILLLASLAVFVFAAWKLFGMYPESRAIDTKNFPLVWLNCCSRNGSRGYPSYALE